MFQRDRDRILHCKSFRRLKQKTQVFLLPKGDHIGQAHDLALQSMGTAAGLMVHDPVNDLPGEVQSPPFLFQALCHTDTLDEYDGAQCDHQQYGSA